MKIFFPVIPAQAGSHNPSLIRMISGVWITVCAGMTDMTRVSHA